MGPYVEIKPPHEIDRALGRPEFPPPGNIHVSTEKLQSGWPMNRLDEVLPNVWRPDIA
jgi:hypothetical protein